MRKYFSNLYLKLRVIWCNKIFGAYYIKKNMS